MKKTPRHSSDAPARTGEPSSPGPMRDFSRSLPMALLRAREAVMGRFRPTLREYELTEQQWRVLRALSSVDEPLRPSELAQMTLISMPSLSRLLKTLETRRIIRRAADTGDLRSARLSMTGSGHALVAVIAPLSEASYGEIAKLLGDKDLDRLYRLLDKVAHRLGAEQDLDLEQD